MHRRAALQGKLVWMFKLKLKRRLPKYKDVCPKVLDDCATDEEKAFTASHPRENPNAPFLVLGGFADFILPLTAVNGHGAIIGLANVAPHACAKLFDISVASLSDPSLLHEAQRLQGIVARGDFTIAKASIAGTKFLLEKLYGYGGLPRKPLPPISHEAARALWEHPHVQELIATERSGKVSQ
ncbi:uncharacterized protein PHACADRAFT_201197 [Phanerochaete carnosa HHB-10118-sp]|uniref:Uncharacterized protein n=1 Tax=Phanerochaete carnosa (strain HHB-10118-sp) TaxID=650164 RepID=K5VEB6_PHACS|nr:uncharacterized protein PHACADRAFT_201197 [Phanerochaete carnosa HHB-10118-sp]EKM49488.1 hypothetical protein PHACADRAFT_201197 [Phanerochaete carnosa HHB-10118-sp]